MPKIRSTSPDGAASYLVDTANAKTKGSSLDTGAVHIISDHENELKDCEQQSSLLLPANEHTFSNCLND